MNRPYPAKLWLALLIILPLAYNPLSRWQYEPDKVALLLAFAGLLLGTSFWQGAIPQPAKNTAEKWFAAFLLVNLLAVFGSEMPHWALWGDPAWRNGLLVTLASVIIFGLARRQLYALERQRPLTQTIVWTGAVVSLFGIFEQLRANPFVTDEDPVRVSATLAHANLLALYLAMTVPLTLMAIAQRWLRRDIGLIVLVLQGVCLILTYSRAGWLAALAGISIFVGLWTWQKRRKTLARLMLVGTLVGLMALFILSMLPPLPASAPHTVQTATNMFRWKGATAQIRFLGWEAAADAIQKRPILGYGPANYGIILERHLPPELAPFGGAEALGGRTHNRLIEVLIETGVVGSVVYLGLMIALFIPLIRHILTTPSTGDHFRIGLIAAMSANLIGTQFSFESAAGITLFWILAGMAHAEPMSGVQTRPLQRQPAMGIIATGIGLLAMALIVVPDMLAYRGESQCGKNLNCDPNQTLRYAVDLSPTPEVFEMALANAASEEEFDWQSGNDILRNLVARYPAVVRFRQAYALYLRRWSAAAQNNEIAADAIDEYSRTLALSPRDPDLWIDRGLVWLQMGEAGFALMDFQQANVLLDDYTRYYGAMSIYASMQGDVAAAQRWQDLAREAQAQWDNWVWRR